MSLFVLGLNKLTSKKGKAINLIVYMDIAQLMIYVQQFEEDKLNERKENQSNKAKLDNPNHSKQRVENGN